MVVLLMARGSAQNIAPNPMPTLDYQISVSPAGVDAVQGSSASATINIGALNGFTGSVSLAATAGVPKGVTATFEPSSVTGSGTSTLSLKTTSDAALGTATITITATSGQIKHTASVSLTVGKSCTSVDSPHSTDCDILATIAEIVAPDSPAFTLLGVNPSNISKPTTPAQFAANVINAFDDNGHFQSGTALDVVPYLVFAGHSRGLGKLVPAPGKTWSGTEQFHGYVNRVLTRTSFSFATIKGTSNPDTSVRLATGIRAVLLDRNDPRANFQSCVAKIDIALDPAKLAAIGADAQKEAEIKKAIEDCRTKKPARVWNATSLTIAGAAAWISTDGLTSSLARNGGGFWASFALGLGTWGQLIANGRRLTGQHIVPPNSGASTTAASGNFVLQDSSIGGGAFRFGRSDFNGIVEGLYIGKKTGGVVDSYPEFGFGVEKKLAEKVYLELNYRYDVNSKVNTSGILANLKWSFSQASKLAK
jgi:hypothetical protein